MPSSHDYIKDKRNNKIKIFVNNKFLTRDKANISVFDSGFLLGDGVWSGIRFHNNKFLFLKDHLDRLFDDAKKIDLKIHLSKKEISKILFNTIKINKMKTDVHIRLVVSRGIKSTPYQDPAFTISKPTIVIIPEYKQPQESVYKKGLILITVPAYKFLFSKKDEILGHYRRYNKEEIKKFFKNFNPIKLTYFNFLLFFP